jgi:hypothetical protein
MTPVAFGSTPKVSRISQVPSHILKFLGLPHVFTHTHQHSAFRAFNDKSLPTVKEWTVAVEYLPSHKYRIVEGHNV